MTFLGGNSWDFSLNPESALSNGVLEIVVPRWFW
jgi:hypothetical protein